MFETIKKIYKSMFVGKTTEEMVNEFIEAFPGRCMICSYHEYGVREGLTSGKVADHDCIEDVGNERILVLPKLQG